MNDQETKSVIYLALDPLPFSGESALPSCVQESMMERIFAAILPLRSSLAASEAALVQAKQEAQANLMQLNLIVAERDEETRKLAELTQAAQENDASLRAANTALSAQVEELRGRLDKQNARMDWLAHANRPMEEINDVASLQGQYFVEAIDRYLDAARARAHAKQSGEAGAPAVEPGSSS